MQLVILGGSGQVGGHVVSQAVEAGHSVTLLLRPETGFDAPPGVRIVRGALSNETALDAVLDGAHAVLSCIGMQRKNPANPWSASRSPPDLCEVAARSIVAGMQRMGVPRVVAISAAGVGDSAPRLNLVMRFFLATTMIGTAYRDLARMESVYAESGLDWLAPRPTRLTDGPGGTDLTVTETFGTMDAIARRDVARWMLEALDAPRWPAADWGGRTPQITGCRARPARALQRPVLSSSP